ncbi:MAG: deoxyribonuclease IV [Nanoarchaeota archaeon]|nr:deoxyribonuclease IV [Nanoarchaeota archaeon]
MLLGAHESTSGGYYKAFLRGKEDDCDCIQVFTKSPRMWNAKPLKEKEIKKFKDAQSDTKLEPNVSHAMYLLNIANSDAKKLAKAVDYLTVELERAEQLGLMGVVLHPGFSADKNRISLVADSINKAFDKTKGFKVMLLLESMAGQGNSVGSTFEELRDIIKLVSNKKRIGVCFDTCHSFSAGYDIVNDYEGVWKSFDKIIGLKKLVCFHLNDSQYGFNSKHDRHEEIGEGKIGSGFFKKLVNDKRFAKTPGYMELRPKSENDPIYARNIKRLRNMVQ